MTRLLTALVLSAFLVPSVGSAQAPAAKPDPAVEAAVMQLLNEFMDAFNRVDVAAWERTFHFPHYRLASGRMTVLEGPGHQTAASIRDALGPEWDHSGWGRLRIVHASADKAHVDTLFTRYRKDGSIIG